jgi:hypothetical protein
MKGGYEDWEFWLSIVEAGGVAHTIDEVLFHYRKTGGSMHDNALRQDLWLRSQVVLNHPQHFEPGRVRLARRTRKASNPRRPGLLNRLGWIYYLVKDRNRTALRTQFAQLFYSNP